MQNFKGFQNIIQKKEGEIQYRKQQSEQKKKKKRVEKKIRNIWIVKPGEISNRGNGITVCDSLNQIKSILNKKLKHNQTGKLKTYIIQEYLDRPLLYNRRKFDIRCYMMITSVNSVLKAYWYQDGYIRTSGEEFNLDDVSDIYTHLTNDAIQKFSENYQKFEPGNKLSYNDFQRFLDNNFPEKNCNFTKEIIPQLKEIATDTIKATYLKIDSNKKQQTFEIFGLDFMIDYQFKPYLIEVNTNPDINTCAPILQRIIPYMLENAFRIGLDPIFPCPLQWPGPKKYQVQDNILDNNRFEIIFDELVDGAQLKELYQGQSLINDRIGDIDEEEEIKSEDEDNEDLENENN